MNPGSVFNLRRCLLLIRNDFFLNRGLFFRTAAAATGLLFLTFIWDMYAPLPSGFYQKIYFFGLYIGGFTITSKLFSDLHDDMKNAAWLTFPASLLEKLVGRIVLSTVGFIIGLLIFVALISFASEGLTRLLARPSHVLFNPFTETVLSGTMKFWVYQSILLLGVIYFKKSPFIKTVLALVVYILCLGLFSILLMNIVFGKYSDGIIFSMDLGSRMFSFGSHMNEELTAFFMNEAHMTILSATARVVESLFKYALIPLCWVISYFRLKETEV